jgi:hypothetical protein
MNDDLAHHRAIETAQFKAALSDTATQPEFIRATMMPGHLRTLVACPWISAEACFRLVYGPRGASAFWKIECSEPVKWGRFLTVCSSLVAENDQHYVTVRWALASAMLDAHRQKAPFFFGDTAELDHAEHGREVTSDKLKIDVKQAGEWLLDRPKQHHLIPSSLRAFLRPSKETIAEQLNPKKPKQSDVDAWMVDYYRDARARGLPPPKRLEQAFPECQKAIGAVDTQMREAMQKVPKGHKRPRGHRDPQKREKQIG